MTLKFHTLLEVGHLPLFVLGSITTFVLSVSLCWKEMSGLPERVEIDIPISKILSPFYVDT